MTIFHYSTALLECHLREIIRIVNQAGKQLSVPESKFALEMMTGMLATGQDNLTWIAAALKEGITVKNNLKRL